MAELFGYPYLLEGSSNSQTMIGLSGSVPDLKTNVGFQYSSLERLRRIQKFISKYSNKKRSYNLLAVSGKSMMGPRNPKFFDLESDGALIRNKDQQILRLNEFVKFYSEVCLKNKLNPKSNVIVGITDSAIFALYLGIKFPELFTNIVLISPTQEFYIHFYKFFSSIPNLSMKKLPLRNINLFLYSKEDRYKFNKFAHPSIASAQSSLIDLIEKEKLAKNFFYHFKSEGIKNYKQDIDNFLISPGYGKTKEFDRGNHRYKLAG